MICEICKKPGNVTVYEHWISQFLAPDLLISTWYVHDDCAPKTENWRKVG